MLDDRDSDKQEPDRHWGRQSAKSCKSAASKAEKSPHVSCITRFNLFTPDVLTNLGLDLASVGVSDQQRVSATGCKIDSQDPQLVKAIRSVSPLYRSRHGSPDPDDLPDDHLHHLLAIVQSQLDRRTRRSRAKTAADRRSVRPLRRPSNSPSALVLSPMTPPTNPPSFIPPCVRRLCLTVINHRPSRGWTRLVEKVPHHDTSTPTGSGGVLELFSVIPLRCNVLDYYPVPGQFNRAGPKWLL